MSDEMKAAARTKHREEEKKRRTEMSDEMKAAARTKNREGKTRRRTEAAAEQSRVNFTNLTEEVQPAIAMEPGEGVQLHFKNHINCPEANTCLNHLSTYKNHFIDDPNTDKGHEQLKKKIRDQYISPEKQKEVAERFLASQGRGCEWTSLEKKNHFVEGKSRDAPIYICACCGYRALDALDDERLT